MPSAAPWTSDRVAEHLIAAFQRLPDRPVLSRSGGFSIDGAEVEPFGWPERFVSDAWDRRVLMTWARCRAIGASVSERYRDLEWPRRRAERHRQKALTAIARGLAAQDG